MTESIQILMEKDRLQPLADNIKVLKGSDTITLQQMEDTIEETNTDIVSQIDLIAQLTSALQGKSVPGSGEDVTAETETYTDLLDDLEAAVDALPDAGGSGSMLETGTLTGATTMFADPGEVTYYYDLESIPNISTKKLVVMCDVKSPAYYVILSRSATSEDFAVTEPNESIALSPTIDGYVLSAKVSTNTLFVSTIYYAA